MGATGFEPVTSSASRKRSSPELSAPIPLHARRRPESNRCSSFCRAVPNHSATSPCRRKAWAGRCGPAQPGLGAEDGARTRDLNLGKVALYRLSYFRASPHCSVSWIPSGGPITPDFPVLPYRPEEPNPCAPRSVSSKRSTGRGAGSATGTITNWATRSPRAMLHRS